MTVRQLLLHDPLAELEHDSASRAVHERLGQYLPGDIAISRAVALYPFVDERPQRYWDDTTLHEALTLLERDPERTFEAMEHRKAALNRGIDNLFIPSSAALYEASLQESKTQDLVRLSTEFLPGYLRWAEHVFGNLLEVPWAVCKKKSVHGTFDLRGGTHLVRQRGHAALTDGYVESIRNAVAHGKVRFNALEIEFGQTNPERFSASQFLGRFDCLCRTCNALALSVMLFWLRNGRESEPEKVEAIPLSIVTRLVAGAVNRDGFRLTGTAESETLAGRQLHAALSLNLRARPQVLLECARVSARLLECGAVGYDRFVFGVDHGESVNSLVIVLPETLRRLIERDAGSDTLPEAFGETQLLWFSESRWKTRLKAWRTIVRSAFRRARLEILDGWRKAGLWTGKGRFRVRSIENISAQGIARVRVRGVLRNPQDADDVALVNEVLWELVKHGRLRLVRSRGHFDKGIPWPRRPRHVFVELYRSDGPIRWLGSGGWPGGNLVASAERVRGRKPVMVTNPEAVYRGIRIRYSMDRQAAQEALEGIAELAVRLRREPKA